MDSQFIDMPINATDAPPSTHVRGVAPGCQGLMRRALVGFEVQKKTFLCTGTAGYEALQVSLKALVAQQTRPPSRCAAGAPRSV